MQKAPTPGPLSVAFDPTCAKTPWLLSCVASVNGIPVCPYGRVTDVPLPGQPYTILTYPKLDQNGKPIDMTKCVSTMREHQIWTDPLYLVPPYFF